MKRTIGLLLVSLLFSVASLAQKEHVIIFKDVSTGLMYIDGKKYKKTRLWGFDEILGYKEFDVGICRTSFGGYLILNHRSDSVFRKGVKIRLSTEKIIHCSYTGISCSLGGNNISLYRLNNSEIKLLQIHKIRSLIMGDYKKKSVSNYCDPIRKEIQLIYGVSYNVKKEQEDRGLFGNMVIEDYCNEKNN